MGSRRLFWLALLWAMLALTACLSRQTTTTSEGPQLLDTLPSGWTPVTFGRQGLLSEATTWLPINVDGDAQTEYLLFFTFDSGQVGASIYDEQTVGNQTTNPTPQPAPNQPSGTFIPYRLQPSYWHGAGSVGYVAPPGTAPEQLNILEVQRPAVSSSEPMTLTVDSELVIFGADKVMTVAWWYNPFDGYGVAQVGATQALVNRTHLNGEVSAPIQNITALDVITGDLQRSLLCTEKLYVRTDAPAPPDMSGVGHQAAITYEPADRGITFCTMPPPPYPFYPEGVVLAFLRPDNWADSSQTRGAAESYREQFLAAGLSPEQRQALLDAIELPGVDILSAPLVVRDLRTPLTLPKPTSSAALSAAAATDVCAHIANQAGDTARILLLRLSYVPPSPGEGDAARATTDRLAIYDAVDVSSFEDCAVVMSLQIPNTETPQ